MKHCSDANGLSETVDQEAIFDTKLIFAPFSEFDIVSKVPFSQSGSHIIYVALDTFPRIDLLTDFHIDERRKIKEDEWTQAFAKGHPDIVEIFSIFVTHYTKTGLITQSEIFS